MATVLRCGIDDLIEQEDYEGNIPNRVDALVQQERQLAYQIFEKKMASKRAERSALSTLLCPPGDGTAVKIVCRSTKIGDIELTVRAMVTVGELANAIGREYFSDEYSSYDWSLCDAGKTLYDGNTTVSDLHSQSVDVVYLCKKARVTHVFAAIPPPPFRLATAVNRVRREGNSLRSFRCRFYLWFYNLPLASNLTPRKRVVGRLNEMALLYAEANIEMDQALKLVKLMERSAESEWWPFRDTIAWVWYRKGYYKPALAALLHDLPDEAMEDLGVLYHLYFMYKRVDSDFTAQTVRLGFEARLQTIATTSLRQANEVYALERKRVFTDDDLSMPD